MSIEDELKELMINEPLKEVFRDFYSGRLAKFLYKDYISDIKWELRVLGIYDWVKDRVNKNLLSSFITGKDYFYDKGMIDELQLLLDAVRRSFTIHFPRVDIILLGEHVYLSPAIRKNSSLHETLHAFFFRNHRYLKEIEKTGKNEIDAYNKKVNVLAEEIYELYEGIADLIPYSFQSIRPAYEGTIRIWGVVGTSRGKRILKMMKSTGVRKALQVSLHVKTLEELEEELTRSVTSLETRKLSYFFK